MDSTEHIEVGNRISLKMPDGSLRPAVTTPVVTVGIPSPIIPLHYGEIVALGGDFYGDQGDTGGITPSFGPSPISSPSGNRDGQDVFNNAFVSLARAPVPELQGILAVVAKEQAAVQAARQAGKQPSTAFDALGDSLSFQWGDITKGRRYGYSYIDLLTYNMDHFGADARRAYIIGHAEATQRAAALHGKTSLPPSMPGGPARPIEPALLYIYAMNAFADHFLTDLFAAGHLRTPRRALFDIPNTFPAETGLLARAMHDEDNLNGLQVSNQRGDEWKAFGDGKELDEENKRNFDLAVEAVQASADEVYEAFSTGQAQFFDPAALKIAPNPIYQDVADSPPMPARDAQGKNIGNYAPMFWASRATPKGKVWRRGGQDGGFRGAEWKSRDNWALSPQWSIYPMVEDLFSTMLDKDVGLLAMDVARQLKLPIAGRPPA